jgi:hypothetical protein
LIILLIRCFQWWRSRWTASWSWSVLNTVEINDDPGSGDYTCKLSPAGSPQVFLYKGSVRPVVTFFFYKKSLSLNGFVSFASPSLLAHVSPIFAAQKVCVCVSSWDLDTHVFLLSRFSTLLLQIPFSSSTKLIN